MFRAVIYDMDGVLIDSEPLWRKALVAVFSSIGLPITEEMCAQTMGMRLDEGIDYWGRKYPGKIQSPKDVHQQIVERLVKLVHEKGEAMPGVADSLKRLKEHDFKIGLASSSSLSLIETILEKLGIASYFEQVHSAQFEPSGKPHPAVYLSAAQKLGISPTECIAIEDSINGIIAAKAARMACFAVPEPLVQGDRRLGIADRVLDSLRDIDDNLIRDIKENRLNG